MAIIAVMVRDKSNVGIISPPFPCHCTTGREEVKGEINMEIIIKAEAEEVLSLMAGVILTGKTLNSEGLDSVLRADNRPIPPEEVDKKDDDQHYMVSFLRDGLKTTIWNIFDSLYEAWTYALALRENYKKAGRDVCDFKILRWNPSVEDWEVEVTIE